LIIAIGSDHAGFTLKQEIVELLRAEKYEFRDFGTISGEPIDYTDVAREVAEAVAKGKFDKGILICGTGIGVCITANKVPGIRAALCSEEYSARLSREHNNANVLALGGRTLGAELAKDIVRVWLTADFDPESRHARRVAKIEPPSEQGG
jgi:ribose 5-phosphate isomerase B